MRSVASLAVVALALFSSVPAGADGFVQVELGATMPVSDDKYDDFANTSRSTGLRAGYDHALGPAFGTRARWLIGVDVGATLTAFAVNPDLTDGEEFPTRGLRATAGLRWGVSSTAHRAIVRVAAGWDSVSVDWDGPMETFCGDTSTTGSMAFELGASYQRRFGRAFVGVDLTAGRANHKGDRPECRILGSSTEVDVLDWVGLDARASVSAGVRLF